MSEDKAFIANDSALFVFWQDPSTRRWHVVGRLTRRHGQYLFAYTKGATASKSFMPFGRMTNLYQAYRSNDLLPFFRNRVLQKSRPEYPEYLKWLGVDQAAPDPLTILGRTGGMKGTDALSMYPLPAKDDAGNYRVVFFCHGLRHMPDHAMKRIAQLHAGDQLFPMHDLQNAWDEHAVALRSDDPPVFLGYCPRFFAEDFRKLLRKQRKNARISVVRVNENAPVEFRLLLEFSCRWSTGFKPCQGDEYQLLIDSDKGHLQRDATAKSARVG